MDDFVKSLFSKMGGYQADEARLMKEFKRRSAMWAEFLGHPAKWPFLDIATTLVDRGEAVYDTELLEKRLKDLETVDTQFMSKKFAELIIRWESLSEKDQVFLPDPFLPLQIMYQRGCNYFNPHGNMVMFRGGGSVRLSSKPNGDLSNVLAQEPWISEEEIATLQQEVAV